MKHYLILAGALTALSITQTTFSEGKPEERKEERARILKSKRPSERIKALEEEVKNATTEDEKTYFKSQLEEARKVEAFYAKVNQVSAASQNSAASGSKKSEPFSELKGKQGKGKEAEDHGADAMAAYTGTGGRAVVEGPRSLADKLAAVTDLYNVTKDTESAKLLESTAKEIRGNKEAEAGLNKLLDEMLASKGDPQDFLKRITELTKKNKLTAEETADIFKSVCPTGCVPNKGACHIGAQIAKGLTGVVGAALGTYLISGLEFKTQDGKQQCLVSLDKKDGSGNKTVTIDIKDDEQPEEKFPANPQKSS